MDDKLERILQEGIATYAGREPLAGMEDRILGRIVTAERPPKRKVGWFLVLGAAVAAMVLVLIPRPHAAEKARPVEVATVAKVEAISAPVQSEKKQQRLLRKARLPKLAVFPTPTPLTAGERGLMALMKQDPEGTIAVFESLRKQSEPLQIEELKIEPLNTSEGQ